MVKHLRGGSNISALRMRLEMEMMAGYFSGGAGSGAVKVMKLHCVSIRHSILLIIVMSSPVLYENGMSRPHLYRQWHEEVATKVLFYS